MTLHVTFIIIMEKVSSGTPKLLHDILWDSSYRSYVMSQLFSFSNINDVRMSKCYVLHERVCSTVDKGCFRDIPIQFLHY